MLQPIHKLGILAVCGIFLFVQYSCATHSPALPAELRAQLGRIGIVSAQFTPEPEFEGPGIIFLEHIGGAWKGLKSGAKEGAQKGGSIGFYVLEYTQEYHGFWHPGALLLALVSSVVGATVGTIIGSTGGLLEGVINPTDESTPQDPAILGPVLDWYLNELGVQERLRKEVATIAKQSTSYQIMELEKEGPAQRGSQVSYQKLKEQNLDSVLEVNVRSLGIKSDSSSDPIFSVFITVRADLRRVGDEALLYRTNLTHTSPSLPLEEWTLNNALAFRKALDEAYRKLAEQIVATLL